jgi:hypothetical protein
MYIAYKNATYKGPRYIYLLRILGLEESADLGLQQWKRAQFQRVQGGEQ